MENPHAFLVSVTTRLAIDHLRSARCKREVYPGEWLPEPIVEPSCGHDISKHIEMAESLSMAFLVLLESPSPLERAVFLLRQVFDYEYAEIADVVGKSDANCRQVFSRAKRHIAEKRPRFEASKQERESLAHQFLATCQNGSLADLESMLADDVEFHGDGGGVASAVLHPVRGANSVARLIHGFFVKAKSYNVNFFEANGKRPARACRPYAGRIARECHVFADRRWKYQRLPFGNQSRQVGSPRRNHTTDAVIQTEQVRIESPRPLLSDRAVTD